ncbi:alpha-galactosidase [Spinellus fusiger]|nr:alpha-galactosidase [Spinellus fusiger]
MLPLGISQHPANNTWFLVSHNSTYAIGATNTGLLLNLHWGGRLVYFTDVPPACLDTPRSSQDPALTSACEEMPVYGGLRYGPIGLKAEIRHTQTRELDLVWSTATLDHYLHLTLCDRSYPELRVTLVYSVDIDNDIISRYCIVENKTKYPIHLSKAFSAVWHLQPTQIPRYMTTLTGSWSAETQAHKAPLTCGTLTVESRRGLPSCQAYPYFAIEQGTEVYFGTLGWSGSWAIQVTTTWDHRVSISEGVHEHDFGWSVLPNETWKSPVFAAGYTALGMKGARRCLSRHVRTLQKTQTVNPVLFNAWEVAQFDISFDLQILQAAKASAIGVELFVLDDGWFLGRNSDRSGLGDWFADPSKFPHGLKPFADQIHRLGMKFGLWIEPEMVNMDSNLYRSHPEWVYQYPDRTKSEARHQLVLDITRLEVEAYLYDRIHALVKEVGIDYIKWDMNRSLSEVGTTTFRDPREIWVRHVHTWYRLLERLYHDFPGIMIETCTSGGGRADMSALALAYQCWPSDNTRTDARLVIQHGISHVLPPRVLGYWVTDSKIPLSYRFHCAFMGTLGIGHDLSHPSIFLEEFKQWISVYKSMRHVLQLGDLDWLVGPGQITITQTTLEEEVVVLVFQEHDPFGKSLNPIRLEGLVNTHLYRVRMWLDTPFNSTEYTVSGANAMNRGLKIDGFKRSDYNSAVIYLSRIII